MCVSGRTAPTNSSSSSCCGSLSGMRISSIHRLKQLQLTSDFVCCLCICPLPSQLTGEDPDGIPDEPPAKRQHSGPSASERRQDDDDEQQQQQQPEASGRGRQPPGGRLADAWQMPGSLFSLLTETDTSAAAAAAAAAAGDSKDKKKHKEHKHKKEKHKKKDKVGG